MSPHLTASIPPPRLSWPTGDAGFDRWLALATDAEITPTFITDQWPVYLASLTPPANPYLKLDTAALHGAIAMETRWLAFRLGQLIDANRRKRDLAATGEAGASTLARHVANTRVIAASALMARKDRWLMVAALAARETRRAAA